MRIVLTGGGTGGHAYPAISIAEALHAEFPECELLYMGGRESLEAQLAAAAGIPFCELSSRRLGKVFSPGSVLTLASLARGFAEALAVLRRFRPDLVISTGGYASAAVVLAQALRRGKILMHEQNVVPGRTNLWLGRFASRICLTFEDSSRYFPSGKTVVTGLPIRKECLDLPDKKEARAALGLDPDKLTILVYGGSQGARKLNEVIADSIPALRELPVQVVHQAGRRNIEEAERRRESAGWDHYQVHAYFEETRTVYGAADLVVCRCGASTVSEVAAVGLPAILVPYPYAYADHQRLNAEFVARHGGGIVISEADLNPESLTRVIGELVRSPEELEKMSKASRALGKPNAARDVALVAAEVMK